VETLADLEKEIAEYKETEAELDKEYEEIKSKAASQGGEVALTQEQEEELERVREAAAAASDAPRRALTSHNYKLQAARAKAAKLQQDVDELQSEKEEAVREKKDLADRKDKLAQSLETTKGEIDAVEKELQSVQKASRETHSRLDAIDRELDKINSTLREANDQRYKNRDEERLMNALRRLKQHFPGVQGRLVDLCRPTQRRFNLAVTVAAGKDMDAIVVDTKQTGFDCMRYLRDQRVGTATFLPLDSLKVPSPESMESARNMTTSDQRFRLAADVIACDESVKTAVLYAVGNTIICDDLDSARQLCFGSSGGRARRGGGGGHHSGNARTKAVTIGGAVISKAGTMTGGVTRNDTNRAGRWDDQEISKLRKTKDELETERSELSGQSAGRGHDSKMDELRSSLGNLRNRNRFSKSDLEFTTSKLKEKETLVTAKDKRLRQLKPQLKKVEKDITGLQKDVEAAAKAVKDAEDEHLGPFREATGLRDLKAYEEAVGKSREEHAKKKQSVVEHITKLEQQKNYEANRDFQANITRTEKRIATRKTNLKAAKKKEKELKEQVDAARAVLEEAEEAVKEATDNEKSFDSAVKEAQVVFSEAQAERKKISKAITEEESALERLRSKLHETLQKARVEEVDLPTLAQSPAGRTRSSQATHQEEEDEDEEMTSTQAGTSSQLSQETGTVHFSQSDDARVIKERRAANRIDFSKLSNALKQRVSDREERKMRKDFEDQIAKLTADIGGMSPNMKAEEAFDAVTGKLKESSTDFDKAKSDARKAAAAFQKVKNNRARRFNDAFQHIDEALKTIYTDMTKSSKHPLGGNAYLSLDDTEEPYKGGMKFNAMPPMKRFRDMEQLSGGEKTVAALSLLFAIHSFRPAPFFVMDEVDAALDNVNLRKVCNYIRQRSESDFQCIVISLKDMFYERSEGLVGICRDVGTNSSRTLTLDLSKFREDQRETISKRASPRKTRRTSALVASPKRDDDDDDDDDDVDEAEAKERASVGSKKRRSDDGGRQDDDEGDEDGAEERSSRKKRSRGSSASAASKRSSKRRRSSASAASLKRDDDDDDDDGIEESE